MQKYFNAITKAVRLEFSSAYILNLLALQLTLSVGCNISLCTAIPSAACCGIIDQGASKMVPFRIDTRYQYTRVQNAKNRWNAESALRRNPGCICRHWEYSHANHRYDRRLKYEKMATEPQVENFSHRLPRCGAVHVSKSGLKLSTQQLRWDCLICNTSDLCATINNVAQWVT